MRIRKPKTTCLIFKSWCGYCKVVSSYILLIYVGSKLVVTGAKSWNDMNTAARKYWQDIKKLVVYLQCVEHVISETCFAIQGFDVGFKEFRVQNMVAKANVKFPIRLERLAR